MIRRYKALMVEAYFIINVNGFIFPCLKGNWREKKKSFHFMEIPFLSICKLVLGNMIIRIFKICSSIRSILNCKENVHGITIDMEAYTTNMQWVNCICMYNVHCWLYIKVRLFTQFFSPHTHNPAVAVWNFLGFPHNVPMLELLREQNRERQREHSVERRQYHFHQANKTEVL